MNYLSVTKEFMPHNVANIPVEINFFGKIEKIMGSENSRSDHLALNTLLLACMNNSYVEGTAMLTGISGQTVRNHIRDKDPDGLLQINQNLIRTMRDMGLFRKPVIVAFDWHDEMFYGDHDTEGVIGTKNSKGSNYAYEYATASVVMKGMRFSIAVIPVKNRSLMGMVSRLLDIMKSNGIRIETLLPDGGFYSAELIRYLNSSGIRFIMHAPQLRKQCGGKEVDRVYTTKGHRRRKDQQASFRIVSIFGRNKKGVILYIFATNIDIPPIRVLKFFKKRWGIETGYRMIRKFLARTTSKRWRIRLLYFYLAVLLYNLWVLLNILSRVRIIADNIRVFVAPMLIRNNPFATYPIQSNSHSGGDI